LNFLAAPSTQERTKEAIEKGGGRVLSLADVAFELRLDRVMSSPEDIVLVSDVESGCLAYARAAGHLIVSSGSLLKS
jgi:hypothetical protein